MALSLPVGSRWPRQLVGLYGIATERDPPFVLRAPAPSESESFKNSTSLAPSVGRSCSNGTAAKVHDQRAEENAGIICIMRARVGEEWEGGREEGGGHGLFLRSKRMPTDAKNLHKQRCYPLAPLMAWEFPKLGGPKMDPNISCSSV